MTSVSVVIATHNSSATINRAIESCLSQSVPDGIEVVVVDDGSDDHTQSTLMRYHGDVRVKLLQQAVNRGPSHARNVGISASNSPFIALLDADDVMEPDRLQEQLAMFGPDTLEPGAVVSWTREVDKNGRFFRVNQFELEKDKKDQIRQVFLGEISAITPTFLVRRSVLDVVGTFDENLKYREDSDFLMRVIHAFGIQVVRKPLVTRMINPAGLSKSASERDFLRHRRRFFDKACRLYPFLVPLRQKYWSKSYYILGRLLVNRSPYRALGYLRKSLKQGFRLKAAMAYLFVCLSCAATGRR